MKKILFGIILIGLISAAPGDPAIRESLTKGYVRIGHDFVNLELKGQTQATANGSLVWYADNIIGYGSVKISGFKVSAGAAPTTISAQAIYADGSAMNLAAQTITAGTALTALWSPYYKFTLPVGTANRVVSANFIIHD